MSKLQPMEVPHDFSGPIATTTAITLAPVAWFISALNWLDLVLRIAVGFTSFIAGMYAIAHYRNIRETERRRKLATEAAAAVVAPVIVPAVQLTIDSHGTT